MTAKILVVDDSPTIIKVVELVLSKAGYLVVSAHDGEEGIELARSESPDLILLDFVMPRMNGYQVCKILSETPELSDIPVVLMSAKGEQVGERFVKVMGIKDYITKPFSPEAMTAVVAHTLSKYQENEKEDTQPGLDSSKQELKDDADKARKVWKDALSRLRSTLSQAAAAQLVSAPVLSGMNLDSQELILQIKQAFSDDFLEGAIGELKSASPELASGESAMTGELQTIPIVEILPLLASQRQNGILTVSKSNSKIDMYFRDGNVELASAAGVSEEYLLGRYVVEMELMTKDELDQFINELPAQGLLGLQLVRQGKLSDDELKQAMTKQTRELCYELLKWDKGRFTFRVSNDLPPIAEEAGLALSVDAMLIEGFRRVDEWHMIEREIEDFDIVFLRNDDAILRMGRHKLMREEITVLELVNGRNTVREIIRKSRMGSFDVTKMLYRLLSVKLIRKRVSAVAM
ncbi:response regulator [Myxococcota bacterium]|nr:response regulator [Myxococcota bacterium]MBU1533824.1 response regulator [Myxococcota bacterium]